MIGRVLHFQERLTGEPLLATIKRYLTFVVGGFTGWLIIIGLHTFLRDDFGLRPVFSYAAGLLFADIFTFVYHRFITFKIKSKWKVRFIQFSVVVVLVSVANWALFVFGREVLNLPVPDFIMSFVITLFLSVVNFGVNRILIFRHH